MHVIGLVLGYRKVMLIHPCRFTFHGINGLAPNPFKLLVLNDWV